MTVTICLSECFSLSVICLNFALAMNFASHERSVTFFSIFFFLRRSRTESLELLELALSELPGISLFQGLSLLVLNMLYYVLFQRTVFLDILVFLGLLESFFPDGPSIVYAVRGIFSFMRFAHCPL